jgi:hypothetical protein
MGIVHAVIVFVLNEFEMQSITVIIHKHEAIPETAIASHRRKR